MNNHKKIISFLKKVHKTQLKYKGVVFVIDWRWEDEYGLVMTKQTYKTTSKEVEFWLEYVDKQVLEDILYQQIENNVEFQKIQKDIENLLSGLTEEQLDEIFENL